MGNTLGREAINFSSFLFPLGCSTLFLHYVTKLLQPESLKRVSADIAVCLNGSQEG